MSDASLLADVPFLWKDGGAEYKLARPDLDLELFLQARHEGWARDRIESGRAFVSEQAYAEDVEQFNELRSANGFAFGTRVSLRWLCTDAGVTEYLLLVSSKGAKEHGGAKLDRDQLRRHMRDRRADFDAQVKAVLEAHYPGFFRRESPAPGSPNPSTGGSTSCSAAGPG